MTNPPDPQASDPNHQYRYDPYPAPPGYGGEPIDPNPPYQYPPWSAWTPPPYSPYGPPTPYAYPYAMPNALRRPGVTTASAVLAYINAGLLIIAALILLAGASTVNSLTNPLTDGRDWTTELTVDGLLNLITAGLLIAGAVTLTSGSRTGRTLLTAASGLVVIESIYWLTRFEAVQAPVFWAVVFSGLAVLSVIFAWQRSVSDWLAAAAQQLPNR